MALASGRPRIKGLVTHPLIDELRSRRRKRGWTQAKAGEKAGMSEETIKDWERGAATPTLANVAKYAAIFDCDVWLMERSK